MISALRFHNFRSLVDSDWVELAPVTILLGRNSSGKSSFLRFLPLLKQSLQEDTKEPLLWFGRLVDFGGLSEALSVYAKEPEFTVEFKVKLSTVGKRELFFSESGDQLWMIAQGVNRKIFTSPHVEVTAGLSLRSKADGDGAYISRLSIDVYGSRLEMCASEDGSISGVTVDGKMISISGKVRLVNLKGRFFPVIYGSETEVRPEAIWQREIGGPFFNDLLSAIEPLFHHNTKTAKKKTLAAGVCLGDRASFYEHLIKDVPNARRVAPWGNKSDAIPELIDKAWSYVFLKWVPQLFREVNAELQRFAASVRYLAPVRATASRYYRFQELAVDEISPSGDNVPMFINSLSDEDRKSLEDWMAQALGFKVTASRSGGHTALYIHEEGGRADLNLADTGFGYSQILPVVLQIWRSLSKAKGDKKAKDFSSLIAIEQPELHLHPHFQAALADIFAKASESEGVSFVVETHSEHLVNRLGALVEKGAVAARDISIVLFDKASADAPTRVRQARFDKDGVIEGDWPFGFFLPDL